MGRDAVWSGAAYGDFRIADGSRLSPRGRVARNLGGGTDDGRRVWSGGCAGLARARRLERRRGACERNALLVRRAGEAKAISVARREAPRRSS